MSNADIIAQGTEAWRQEKARGRTAWPNYKLIGHALEAIQNDAMAEAGCNSPFGPKYTRAYARRLDAAGLADIPQQVRSRLVKCMRHLPAIEEFLSQLTPAERARLNHPDSIWAHYSRGTRPKLRQAKQHVVEVDRRKDAAGYGPRVEGPEQDKIRFVAAAMRQGWTTDVFRLATIAIEAVDRYDAALMPAEMAPAAPREIQHEMELHA
jgi:hypothetical protein